MRPFIKTFLIGAFFASSLCVQAEPAVLADSLQAVVNDIPITQQEVERFVGPDEQFLYDRYALSQPELFKRKVTALRENGCEFLITREVILHDFKTSIKVPESIIEEVVQERLKEQYPDRIALIKQLQLEGTTLDQKKQKIRDQFIVEQMRYKFIPEPIISPRKLENYYMEHRNDFKIEDQVKMRMIVINKTTPDELEKIRKRVEEILSQLKGGAVFEELARSYSEGSLRQDGGETGWEDFSVVNKVLVDDLNKLKPGEHSGVIETPDGYYLLLLEDRHPAHFRPLNEVRVQIEKNLSAQETDRLAKQWIERLKKKTFVKNF